MKRPRVLVADDHALVANGLRQTLQSDFDVVGTVTDGRELLQAVRDLKPDAAVVDISMPLLNGIDATRQIKRRHPEVAVIILSMHVDPDYVAEAMDAGAAGYVVKHAAPEELITALRTALEGRDYICSQVAEHYERVRRNGMLAERESARIALTTRQREVLQLLAEGRSAREIAEILHISTRTVEFHKYRIMERLGAANTAQLVQFAIRHGLIAG